MTRYSVYIWNDNEAGLKKACRKLKCPRGHYINKALMERLSEEGFV